MQPLLVMDCSNPEILALLCDIPQMVCPIPEWEKALEWLATPGVVCVAFVTRCGVYAAEEHQIVSGYEVTFFHSGIGHSKTFRTKTEACAAVISAYTLGVNQFNVKRIVLAWERMAEDLARVIAEMLIE